MIRKKDQVIFLPHFAQNFAPGRRGLPQAGHADGGAAGVTGAAGAGALTGAPQFLQNFLPGVTGVPQFPHSTGAAGSGGNMIVCDDGSAAPAMTGTTGTAFPERVTEMRFPALSYE
jgi:hypothetical protein